MIVAIDFDGTIVESAFPNIGEIKPNAERVIKRLYGEGHKIIIWTCRPINNKGLEEMKEWLKERNIPYHKVNENIDGLGMTTSNKICADIYIDDRDVNCLERGVNWYGIEEIFERTGVFRLRFPSSPMS
ncbi:HAD hydrolase family protein [uncultured Ilyobacter sp.]|uniref:HAD hydrolase family protein n=1 Tax=uncultured Ilyobacter sp. TaxID=544433 RepID=UPI0029C851B7|nr:HAD hydrolase family protein [uncultured Ilyobacter sp.]